MKHKIFLFAMLFLAISNINLYAESDTLWTTSIGSIVRTVKFSPDGRYVYAAAQGRGPLKLDAQNGAIIKEYEGFKFERERFLKYCMQLSNDGKYLYAADNGKFVYKYDTESNELIDSIGISKEEKLNPFTWTLGLSDKYLFVFYAFTNVNNIIVNEFNVINLDTKQIIKSLNIADVTNIEVHENKNLVAISTAKDDNTEKAYVLIYDLEKLTLIHTFDQHTASITDLSFSPDGSLLASLQYDPGNVKIWDIEKKELIVNFKPIGSRSYCLNLINNKLLALGNGEWERIKLKSINLDNQEEINNINFQTFDFEINNNKVVIANIDFIGLFNSDKLTSIASDFTKDLIYPNPTTNIITIPKSYFEYGQTDISIANISGVVLYQRLITDNAEHLIDVSSYPNASYYLSIKNSKISNTMRFIKE